MQNYGDATYWDERYQKAPCHFEWYQGYAALQPLLVRHFPVESRLLQVGVGTSRLQEDMAKLGGYSRIINTDISAVAVHHMQKQHAQLKQLTYRRGDARSMPEFEDASFSGVFDKGTLDALVCGSNAAEDAARMLLEVSRLLRPGACFMLITYGDPRSRLLYLQLPQLDWVVDVYVIGKQEQLGLVGAPPAWAAGRGEAPPIRGPYRSTDEDTMEALSNLQDVHYVYVCTKLQDAEAGTAAGEVQAAAAKQQVAGSSEQPLPAPMPED